MKIKQLLKEMFYNLDLKVVNIKPHLKLELYEKMAPIFNKITPFGKLNFSCPNSLTCWRVDTLLEKEPDTIDWIPSFKECNILYDIGANIGLYSICAGKKGVAVFAVEPESQNYALLNQNIFSNNLHNKVTGYNFAISNLKKSDKLYIKNMTYGGALNNFGHNEDFNKNVFNEEFQQESISYFVDNLIEVLSFPTPTYIKIDVDGLEAKNGPFKDIFNFTFSRESNNSYTL
ncbi:FkbM family methyltransferase [Fluviispira sanaruensis]|uniref:Methyltransferase FkbM domain-containing protein n=1 Tax=Fluviispira sanaruensis TaxID=2493639 RepID=A0A4P2VM98_FLUSA|nr:FkbM family methyltransferase [Fluviispira sanaruensis]BBH54071.1 hypothetical protein JCM31447_25280 [Fluviispira sanaruensis]